MSDVGAMEFAVFVEWERREAGRERARAVKAIGWQVPLSPGRCGRSPDAGLCSSRCSVCAGRAGLGVWRCRNVVAHLACVPEVLGCTRTDTSEGQRSFGAKTECLLSVSRFLRCWKQTDTRKLHRMRRHICMPGHVDRQIFLWCGTELNAVTIDAWQTTFRPYQTRYRLCGVHFWTQRKAISEGCLR